ncbi:MAG: outer membrane protein assembly factor BamB [Venatoribacter sp.]
MLRAFAFGLALLLAGCATTSISNLSFSNQAKIKILWKKDQGEGSVESYLRLEPAVEDNTIYAADPSGMLRALKLDNGSNLWSIQVDQRISSGVTLVGEQLLLTTRDGFLRSFNKSNGAAGWAVKLPSEAVSSVSVDNDKAYVHSVDGHITAFNLSDGRQMWTYESAMPVLTVRGTSKPLVLDQFVIVGLASGKVVALDKSLGVPRWDVRLASPDGRSELERLVDIDGHPIDNDGVVYAASYHGKLAGIGLNGETLWEEAASTYTTPALALGNLYLTLDDDVVQAFDTRNGAKVWQQDALKGRKLGQVTAYGRYLFVADNEGYLYLLSQMNGELLHSRLLRPKPLHVNYPNQSASTQWRELRGKHMGIRSVPVVTDRGVLIYSNSGELILVDAK